MYTKLQVTTLQIYLRGAATGSGSDGTLPKLADLKLDAMSFNLGSWTCHSVSPPCLLLRAHKTKRPYLSQGGKKIEDTHKKYE